MINIHFFKPNMTASDSYIMNNRKALKCLSQFYFHIWQQHNVSTRTLGKYYGQRLTSIFYITQNVVLCAVSGIVKSLKLWWFFRYHFAGSSFFHPIISTSVLFDGVTIWMNNYISRKTMDVMINYGRHWGCPGVVWRLNVHIKASTEWQNFTNDIFRYSFLKYNICVLNQISIV